MGNNNYIDWDALSDGHDGESEPDDHMGTMCIEYIIDNSFEHFHLREPEEKD